MTPPQPQLAQAVETKRFMDLQDVLLVSGVASLVGGVAMWSRPAALILFGLLCLVAVLLIQMADREKTSAHGIRGVEKRQAS